MTRLRSRFKKHPRGVIAVLAALLIVVMLGMIAFAVDIGYLGLARTQLQAAADSGALAAAATATMSRADMENVAKTYAANANTVAGRPVQLNSTDIEYGTWDTANRSFTPSAQAGNAVRVTVRTDANNGGQTGLFFGRIFNLSGVTQSASAIATMNPRDICFVIDLSGSMNDDTEPDNTSSINSNFAAQGYPTIGSQLLNQVYADFSYPVTDGTETSQFIGQSRGVPKQSSMSSTLSRLYSSSYSSQSYSLWKSTVPSAYRIVSGDSSKTNAATGERLDIHKAMSWIMDVQMVSAQVMPGVKPTPASATTSNYNYWRSYINLYWDKLGYRSYVQFMMGYGARDAQPGSSYTGGSSLYTPLSQFNTTDCPWHTETTAGGSFSFPPREMPTHAARRAIIAALQVVKNCNQNIIDPNQRDWVSIVTFDLRASGAVLQVPLTSDYDAAMRGSTKLQAVADSEGASTTTDTGLIAAYNHIKPQAEGGLGRTSTNKIVVLLTDGMPNQHVTNDTVLGNQKLQYPNPNYTGNNDKDAALMQTSLMQGKNWYLYPVPVGLGCDYDFMDRMARMGVTADSNGQSPRGSGNPGDYEAVLTQIFNNIITNPKLRLVK